MFNPQARWDRPLPNDVQFPGEPVDVVVSCKQAGFFPLWFFFHGVKHVIKNVQLTWQENKGREEFHLFSVCDELNNRYTLCCSRQSLRWRVIADGD
ncbi:MAG: hypothetical protein PHO30_00820 [Candidatus Omnitrophica bacterium]|nr:hypothetical protein [Candidatus Omnitrophota bacterium]